MEFLPSGLDLSSTVLGLIVSKRDPTQGSYVSALKQHLTDDFNTSEDTRPIRINHICSLALQYQVFAE